MMSRRQPTTRGGPAGYVDQFDSDVAPVPTEHMCSAALQIESSPSGLVFYLQRAHVNVCGFVVYTTTLLASSYPKHDILIPGTLAGS